MPRVGVTGHMNLPPATATSVAGAMADLLGSFTTASLTGLSCIAPGADSIFAEVVLTLGGRLEVYLPSKDYRQRKVGPEFAPQFDRLLADAAEVHVMPFERANREAYEAANNALLDSSDLLIAVWDGHSPPDRGGTGAVVGAARARGIPVSIVWPEGAARS